MVKKLAIISTHPIQYYAPVFQLLAKKIALKVFYTLGKSEVSQFDIGFKKPITWDLPLLEGYDHIFVNNVAKSPGTHHFNGIVNPTLITEIEAYQADVILIYGWASKSHLDAIRYFSGKIPVFFRGDSTLLDQKKSVKNLFKTIFLRFVYSHIDFAFYVGQANKAYFKKYGLKEDQLIFAPHAIDNDRFAEDRSNEADALREKFNIAEEDILILFAGKLEAKKNPMLLLDAFLEITNESEVGRQKTEEKKLEDGSPKSEEKGGNENRSFDYAQDDELIQNESEDRGPKNKKESEDRGPRSEDNAVKENALRQAQIDSITTNKEQAATSNKQQTTSNEKRKTNKIHLLFVGNGELEESLKLKVKSSMQNESDDRCRKSEEQVFSKGSSYNENPHLKSQISNLKCNNIHFIDFQNQTEMPVVYQACDLFCLPSVSETWGLAVNEAMACRKAVLVSDRVGCAKDLVTNENGDVFKSSEISELKQKLLNLTASKNELSIMGEKSLDKVSIWNFEIQSQIINEYVGR